jgi:hypothetical protein
MRSVKLLTDALRVAAAIGDRWYVSTGEGAVGPVQLELIARGIQAGKVPLDCYVRNEAWTVWRPLSDVAQVSVSEEDQAPARTAFEELVIRESQPTLRQIPGWNATPTPSEPTLLDPRAPAHAAHARGLRGDEPRCAPETPAPRSTQPTQQQNA